jgi:hypothetical protein
MNYKTVQIQKLKYIYLINCQIQNNIHHYRVIINMVRTGLLK